MSNTRTRYKSSEELFQYAKKYDAWAANQVKNYSSIEGHYPIYCSHAKGAYLWDIDQNRYIDYVLGYGTIVLGHADDRITEAVLEELKKGTCASPLWKPEQVQLTELLTSVIPGAEMAFLMKTGSDATSGAVRLARVHTGRNKVARWGYNGWHDWATPKPQGVPLSIQDDTLIFTYNDIDSLKRIFSNHPNQIACVLMMPFENEEPYLGFLQEVRHVAHEHGALFILDEMRLGFRLSLGGAQEYFGIQADLATYSKSLSNGYPISALVGQADIFQGMKQTKMTATYFGSSTEMVAALTTISILQNTDAIAHIWEIGKLFQEGLKMLIKDLMIPAKVLGYPPYPYIEFTIAENNLREKAKFIFYSRAAELGILFHPSHHWYISAAHTKEDIEYTLEACKKSFESVQLNI